MQPIYATSIKINKSCFHLILRSGENLKNAGVYLVRQELNPAVKERTLLPFAARIRGRTPLRRSWILLRWIQTMRTGAFWFLLPRPVCLKRREIPLRRRIRHALHLCILSFLEEASGCV